MEEKILKIEKLDHQGRGIGFLNDKIVFVPFCVPGDIVNIKVIKEKKKYIEAEVNKYIEKDNKHINQNCPFYKICGGCDLRHICYEEQLKFKENKVKEIMSKFVSKDIVVNKIIGSDLRDNYRNKVTFRVNEKLGLCKKNSNDVIRIDNCLLLDTKINELIKHINSMDLTGVNSVVIRCAYFTKQIMIVFYINEKFVEEPLFLKEYVDTIVINKNRKEEIIYGKGNIFEKLGNLMFKISPSSFFQVNSKQTLNLYNLVLDKCHLTGKEIVYDLYCGTGTISLFLNKKCKKVIGIEINEDATRDANENKKINNIDNCTFLVGDVSKIIKSQKENPDIIVVDPPRAGLDNITIENIFRLNPQKIVYVSCDPVTLARDLNILQEKYNIVDVTPVDMFPNTYHVECVSVLHRRNLEK